MLRSAHELLPISLAARIDPYPSPIADFSLTSLYLTIAAPLDRSWFFGT
ncbi:MAG: hypothetical protein ISN28_14120 [Ectothiorhodospiraceae bacterium AqS1]|nr:hypothetical protein [Ectothiorhodospiraceae bacterium AqS1]